MLELGVLDRRQGKPFIHMCTCAISLGTGLCKIRQHVVCTIYARARSGIYARQGVGMFKKVVQSMNDIYALSSGLTSPNSSASAKAATASSSLLNFLKQACA